MATNTYVALDQITISSATPSITFNSIPDTYTDLVVICYFSASSSNVVTPSLRFNGDTTSAYSSTSVYGTGSTTTSVRNATTMMYLGDYAAGITTHAPDPYILHINSYRNTSTYKSVLCRYNQINSSNAEVGITAGLWRSQNAISSITILSNGGQNYAVGSTFALYGIRAEGISPAPKATGGAIYSDDTYYYHAFGSSGTFTPTQSITADVLVVAGGGSGGGCGNSSGGPYVAGGGGAGGVRAATLSLSASAYTVSVGGGGSASGGFSRGNSGTNSYISGSGITTLTASGGGAGAGGDGGSVGAALAGGSGGGGAGFTSTSGGAGNAGSYSPVEGYAGGYGGAYTYSQGGGGGGAGGAGVDGSASNTGGQGGVGLTTYSTYGLVTGTGQNIAGTVYYAGGGAGGVENTSGTIKLGGSGGGGAGGNSATAPTNGLANSGSGGGGAGRNQYGANGGSGVVIVRYTKA